MSKVNCRLHTSFMLLDFHHNYFFLLTAFLFNLPLIWVIFPVKLLKNTLLGHNIKSALLHTHTYTKYIHTYTIYIHIYFTQYIVNHICSQECWLYEWGMLNKMITHNPAASERKEQLAQLWSHETRQTKHIHIAHIVRPYSFIKLKFIKNICLSCKTLID